MENQNWQDLVKELDEKRTVSNAEIARLTKMKPQHVSRFFGGETSPNLKTFLKIANACGLYYESK